MTKKPAAPSAVTAEILSYRHPDRRKNNPEVGMVTPATDPDEGKTRWQHDLHLDPALSWTGKAERTSFDVDTVSLHVHERIDPASILSALRKKVGAGETAKEKDIRAELDEDALEAFHGTVSLPFEAGPNNKAAVKIVDDRGIESLRIVALD